MFNPSLANRQSRMMFPERPQMGPRAHTMPMQPGMAPMPAQGGESNPMGNAMQMMAMQKMLSGQQDGQASTPSLLSLLSGPGLGGGSGAGAGGAAMGGVDSADIGANIGLGGTGQPWYSGLMGMFGG